MTRATMLLGWVLVILSVLLWLALVATVATINESDAAGNGLSYSYAVLMAIALWVLLAALTLLAASRGAMPDWTKVAALVLLPLSLAATVATIGLLAGRGAQASGWPIVVPAVVPALVVGYALWAVLPSFRSVLSPAIVSRVAWGAVFVLSLVPWPLRRERARRDAITRAGSEAAHLAESDSASRALEAQFQALGTDTPLRSWLIFATAGNDLRERTLAGIRTLPRRQAEAEAMRGDDLAMLMSELRNLGLEATPALCASANEFLASHADSFRSRVAVTTRYEIEGSTIERYLFAMQWLAGHGCNLTQALDAYEAVTRLFPAAPAREQYLARLASLRVAPSR